MTRDVAELVAALAEAAKKGGRKRYDPATGAVAYEVGPVFIYNSAGVFAYMARLNEDEFGLTLYVSTGGHADVDKGEDWHTSLEWRPVPCDRVPLSALELLLEAANLGEEARAPWEDYEGGAAE